MPTLLGQQHYPMWYNFDRKVLISMSNNVKVFTLNYIMRDTSCGLLLQVFGVARCMLDGPANWHSI